MEDQQTIGHSGHCIWGKGRERIQTVHRDRDRYITRGVHVPQRPLTSWQPLALARVPRSSAACILRLLALAWPPSGWKVSVRGLFYFFTQTHCPGVSYPLGCKGTEGLGLTSNPETVSANHCLHGVGLCSPSRVSAFPSR